ncbi:MAG: ribonuclease III [Candidatus Ryanbacteria bacterium RIFCSPHIGHO2_02_FULL_45_43]|uniref:Ribonuclease 3 n=1 Tax=Candidatus Ryanbacteria bacterium RIFCSPHIGHO2_01_45_13 TaxID=1802112 RepID=A0A1G2FZP0_9BACT|nr:MAG: ribonuclease III [Candidatus Ryanbacteria bacterium RIFCSPHIGHO2_01_FULL_44_130]OGZ43516.1 MAG: ribonuclease III [Candidatus Ryanbacteria bacterium RIFCSPHIGHO2_01_45_13]OGZ47860.1 MAG: ribonuclease III [Candidatus Ryanbacteria bacterium RIFCSPHIGHO2_02_FULL_45_43]OGZ49905.1 MAG: ribonuclease III [Candidatus Ryanbacteria bacterium RIFCSPHIGHO2_12_FULL_44_20]OGZ51015.1 MAG: ribonuclease III [Candidatus Ryanbacteria bacterium RIFCSPLOWO2_01_FULL_44_230]OGZ54223.1 MAG: ribonuclease III [C
MKSFSSLEKEFGVTFKNKDLLLQALTHRSYLNENPGFRLGHNERLEFLGDAVIELVITECLYTEYPDKPEGELTSIRAALVNADMLSTVARKLGFNSHLLLSRGETKDVGRARDYILANTFEAVVGAIYLDQGYKAVSTFLQKVLMPYAKDIVEKKLWKDPKSSFQEEAQERVGITPTYRVLSEEGPDHRRFFRVGVFLKDELVAEGDGLSKQEAEAAAAQLGLQVKRWQ